MHELSAHYQPDMKQKQHSNLKLSTSEPRSLPDLSTAERLTHLMHDAMVQDNVMTFSHSG